jgi:hypothetical protein
MSDRETLEAMLIRAGVKFTSGVYGNDQIFTTLIVESDGSEVNQGYIGFHTEFVFDRSGQLRSMGAWE